jgi:hypothetical protein
MYAENENLTVIIILCNNYVMRKKNPVDYKRVTMYLPVDLINRVKMLALVSNTSMSNFTRISLVKQVKQMNENSNVDL